VIGVRELTRRYGDRAALDAVSFEVAPGEIVGLLGPNGAGKSTLLRICAGLQDPDSGIVEIAGHDLWRQPLEARAELGYMADDPAFYGELSALELLSFLAGVRGLDPAAARHRAERLLERLGLGSRADEPVERYSHGMLKKLSFVAAVLHRPRALLCDEALQGFDLEAGLTARAELTELARGGTAVLFSSHAAPELERLCDRIVMLHQGRVRRVLARADWGASAARSSPLERAFLELVGAPTNPENS